CVYGGRTRAFYFRALRREENIYNRAPSLTLALGRRLAIIDIQPAQLRGGGVAHCATSANAAAAASAAFCASETARSALASASLRRANSAAARCWSAVSGS